MGLLSGHRLQKVNATWLKEKGFFKTGWGRPDGRYNNGKCKWNKEHTCWEFFDDEYDWYYRIIIYYYPKHFTAYVTPFNMNGQHPAGNCLICVESPSGMLTESKQLITYCEDIEAAIVWAQREIDRKNMEWDNIGY